MRNPKNVARNDSAPQTQKNSPSNDTQGVPRNSVPENPAPEKSTTDDEQAQKTKLYRGKMVL